MNMGILPISNNSRIPPKRKQPSFSGCTLTPEAARYLKLLMNTKPTKSTQKSIVDMLKFLSASTLPILIFYQKDDENGTNFNLKIGDPSQKNPAKDIDMAIDFTKPKSFSELKKRITTIEENIKIVNSMGTAHRWNFIKVLKKMLEKSAPTNTGKPIEIDFTKIPMVLNGVDGDIGELKV